MDDIGSFLRAERTQRGISQAGMASILGLTRQKLQLLEAGQPGVHAETVLWALAELGVTLLAVPRFEGSAESVDRILSSRKAPS